MAVEKKLFFREVDLPEHYIVLVKRGARAQLRIAQPFFIVFEFGNICYDADNAIYSVSSVRQQ